MRFKLSNYCIISDAISSESPQSERIIFSTRTGKGISISRYILELVQNSCFDSIPDKVFTILMYHEIIVPEEEDELFMVVNKKLLTANDTICHHKLIQIYPNLTTEIQVQEKLLKYRSINCEIRVSIFINENIELGLSQMRWAKTFLDNNNANEQNIIFELNFFSIEISSLINLLPLNNFGINSINFIFRSDIQSASMYLKSLTSCAKIHSYLQEINNEVFIIFSHDQYNELVDCIPLINSQPIFPFKLNIVPILIHDFDQFDYLEKSILRKLKESKIQMRFIPEMDFKYTSVEKIDSYEIGINTFGRLGIVDFDLLNRPKITKQLSRLFFDDVFAKIILNQEIKCGKCIFLPLCGGRIDKSKKDDSDCPSFIRNFMDKVKYHYRILK
jgi:hypothetical protein